jgi:hypothetical protein
MIVELKEQLFQLDLRDFHCVEPLVLLSIINHQPNHTSRPIRSLVFLPRGVNNCFSSEVTTVVGATINNCNN